MKTSRGLLTVIGASCFCASIAQYSVFAYPPPANPNDPTDYLPRINLAFKVFLGRYHYYPLYWYDIEFNCREERNGALCAIEDLRPQRSRRTATFPDSKYRYVISQSSKTRYRVVAVLKNGCPMFYIDERGRTEAVKTRRDQRSLCTTH